MKNEKIRQIWEKFIEEFGEYFKQNEEIWFDTLDELQKYMTENEERPS